jgi:hypothetical protein
MRFRGFGSGEQLRLHDGHTVEVALQRKQTSPL